MQNVTIENVGPVVDFSFDLPDDGGLIVLKGDNGIGKTTILHTAEVLSNGKGNLSKRDGAKEGSASGFGRVLKVRKRTSHTGELEIEGVGDLNLSTLHTPKLKTASGRDKERIATLVRLAGAEAVIDLFYSLVGSREEFDKIVGEDARLCTDLVEMTAKVKRDIEGSSRIHEKESETARANARAKRDQIEGVDLTALSDKATLDSCLETVIRNHATMEQQISEYNAATDRAVLARRDRDIAVAEYDGPSVEVATSDYESHKHGHDTLVTDVDRIREDLERAMKKLGLAEKDVELASQVRDGALRHRDHIAGWSKTIEECDGAATAPRPEDVTGALNETLIARAACEQGVRVRDAIRSESEADIQQMKADESLRLSIELRDAAKSTANILLEAVASIDGCPLRVEFDDNGDTRLVIETARSPRTFFDELSDGEKWKVIVPLALGENKLVVLPQAAYGELQPANRLLLHELAVKSRGWILSAEATDGPLGAAPYVAEETAVLA